MEQPLSDDDDNNNDDSEVENLQGSSDGVCADFVCNATAKNVQHTDFH